MPERSKVYTREIYIYIASAAAARGDKRREPRAHENGRTKAYKPSTHAACRCTDCVFFALGRLSSPAATYLWPFFIHKPVFFFTCARDDSRAHDSAMNGFLNVVLFRLCLQNGVGGDHRAEDKGAHVRQSDDRRVRLGSATWCTCVSICPHVSFSIVCMSICMRVYNSLSLSLSLSLLRHTAVAAYTLYQRALAHTRSIQFINPRVLCSSLWRRTSVIPAR